MPKASQRSIERRLPALMVVVLLVVVVSVSWIAHRELERALLASVRDRLEGAQHLLADLLGQSFDARRNVLAAVATRAEIAAYLASPTDSTLAAAVRQLTTVASASAATHAVELWSAAGECRVRMSRSAPGQPLELRSDGDALADACRADPLSVGAGDGISPMRSAGENAEYDLVTSVRAPAASGGALLGRLVEVRWISDVRTSALIEGLIGSEADIFLGSRRGDAWSDFAQLVEGPPVDSTTRGLVRYVDAAGSERIGVAGPLPGAPWLVWVQFPSGAVLAPRNAFLQRAGLATILILLLGAAGTWVASHRIVVPLRHVTEAAEEIAAGRYASRVVGSGSDEVGRLAAAFNVMARRIEDHSRELEDRVAARTEELQGALHQLEEAQDRLVRREKLAMLGQLASGVGHELRNPLGVMSNAVYYLEMVLHDAREEVREYLGIIRGQIGLSEKIVEDLLDFARIKPPQKESVPLETLVDDQLARLAPPADVVIERDFPPELPAAYVDRIQIGQVVLNLLTNAFQAMEDGKGTLTVRGVQNGPGRARLEVSDTGVGIPEQNLEKIFEPLYTTKARGIGLGLAVARSLAEANGGELYATSHPGAGATFALELPSRSDPRA